MKKINDKREYYRNDYLKSDHWKELKKKKFLYNPCCQRCNSIHVLDVHHKRYKNLYDVSLRDLIVLCRGCHKKIHLKLDKEKNEESKKEDFRYRKRLRRRCLKRVAKMVNMNLLELTSLLKAKGLIGEDYLEISSRKFFYY